MTRPRLRDATLDDAPSLARLMGVLGYPTTVEAMYVRLESIGADSDYRTVVAEVAGTVRGVIGLRRELVYEGDDVYVRLMVLVVDNGFQGQGIGTALAAEAESWARSLGATAITLTTRHERHDAHRFYERLGYSSTGLRFSKRLTE